jgi:DNA-binding winged helix-turn-helix (wHTH) protein
MEPAQTTNIVDVYVNYLRRKLKDPTPGQLIRTVRGQGYVVPGQREAIVGLAAATEGLGVRVSAAASMKAN